ncbi:MAG TPA: glycosyltransferase family 87 protein [Candidatus Limnocylindrales bacterium]|nr:glycosyltransferase family 87 protein [Candidatus Limnocylindrales bacterium]
MANQRVTALDTAPSTARRWADGAARRLARLPPLRALKSRPIVGLAAALGAWAVVVAFSEPWGRLWGTGQDARCYWQASLANPYLHSEWNDPIAYVYSPAFLQLVSPLTALPWQLFMAAWTAILIGSAAFLTGPRLLAAGLLFPFTAMEIAGGNVSLPIAVAIVLGFRWPATWALILLTKITPGIALLWFAVRREWRALAIAAAATAAIVALSALVMPAAWREWIDVIIGNTGKGGTWASVPIPLWIRLPAAVAVVVWGARTDRPWTVPVSAMLALPALWYGGISMLLAVILLRDADRARRWLPHPR